jgi:hypothetical protein
MGKDERKPSYLNHDAMKYPGVGQYNISPGRTNVAGIPYEELKNQEIGYSSIHKTNISPTTFSKADRNLDSPIRRLPMHGHRNSVDVPSDRDNSFSRGLGHSNALEGSPLKQAAGSIIAAIRSQTPGPSSYNYDAMKVKSNNPAYSFGIM